METIATYNYDEIEITAAIQKDNIIGFQFHPEKSGQVGLDIIKKFLSLYKKARSQEEKLRFLAGLHPNYAQRNHFPSTEYSDYIHFSI